MSDTETAVVAEPRELRVIGAFDSFDAVRQFVEEDDVEKELGLAPGDLAIVNEDLVRLMPSGAFASVINVVDEFGAPADHAEAFERSMTEIERIVLQCEFQSGSLLSTFVSTLVGIFKNRPKQWSQMSEGEQRDMKTKLENIGKDLIRRITRVVSEGEEISVAGKLESYTHKGSFDLKISAGADENAALELFKMQGHDIIIKSADSKRFLDDTNDDDIDPDQAPLPFADGPDSFDDDADSDEQDDDEVTDEQLDSIAEEVVEEQAEEVDDTGEDVAVEGDNADIEADPVDSDADGDEVEILEDPLNVHIAEALEEDAGDAPGEYEGRTNPDDDPSPEGAPEFTEATDEELAAQKDRALGDTLPAADYVGPKEPEMAEVGESWINTSKDDARPKFKHPNGNWYLKPPKPAPEPSDDSDDSGFPSVDD